MHNIIGGENQKGVYDLTYNRNRVSGTIEIEPEVSIHHYEKEEVKPWRKMGYVTILAQLDESQPDLITSSAGITGLIRLELKKDTVIFSSSPFLYDT